MSNNSEVLSTLQNGSSSLESAMWTYLFSLFEIPRPSGFEEPVVEFIAKVADKHGWEVERDEARNIVVHVPAQGRPDAPALALQAHTDMVCVAEDASWDPLTGRIQARLFDKDGVRFLGAVGTSLGADDGVGVAAALAIAEDTELERGPLDLVFTAEEETCLGGACALSPAMLRARAVVNLDSEEECALIVGSAGGFTHTMRVPAQPETLPQGFEMLTFRLSGLTGGHTGAEIDSGRASAVQLWGRAVTAAAQAGHEVRVVSVKGGVADNAICKEVVSQLAVPATAAAAAAAALREIGAAIVAEVAAADPETVITVEQAAAASQAYTTEASARIAGYAATALYGPLAFDDMVNPVNGKPCVRTSFATTIVDSGSAGVAFTGSARSSAMPELDGVYTRLAAAAALGGLQCGPREAEYGAWAPLPASRLREVAAAAAERVFGRAPAVYAIHAGLEAGEILAKFPTGEAEAVSVGPDVFDPHCPAERLGVESARRFLKLVSDIVVDFSS